MQSSAKKNKFDDTDFTKSFEEAMKRIPQSDGRKDIFDLLKQGLANAQTVNNESSWMASADDFFKEARVLNDELKTILYKGSIMGFEKVLEFNPGNLTAKARLGASYVESASLLGNPPMKGIAILREVVKQDSNNIEANLQLGLFSVSSQQFDKAIERFNRILKIDSTQVDMYAYLGDVYMQMGNKPKAIESLENYKNRVKDNVTIRNIDNYIKKLKIN